MTTSDQVRLRSLKYGAKGQIWVLERKGRSILLCSATTLKIKTRDRTNTTTGSTFRPGDSSVYKRSMVLLEPPAPAARVLFGRALAIFSFWSAAARRRIAVRAPPGGAGDEGRAVLEPMTPPDAASVGEDARGDDYHKIVREVHPRRSPQVVQHC